MLWYGVRWTCIPFWRDGMHCQSLVQQNPASSGYKPLDFKTLPYTINMCCLEQIIQPEEVASKTGLGYLHTTHCLANGEVMISSLGTSDGEGEGKVISFLPRVITSFN